MTRPARLSFLLVGLLASCLRGPPDATPASRLAPGDGSFAARQTAAFAVAFAGPRGTGVDPREPAVTVLFNRPMRALDAPEDAGLPPLRVETKEGRPVAGSLRWLGTHGLLFLPDAPLPGATAFAVTVPAGTRAIDGSALALPYRFEFSTPAPRVLATTPQPGAADMRPRDSFQVVFNQAVDPAVVERAAAMTVDGKPVSIRVTRSRPPPDTSPERVVAITPSAPLPLDSAVVLSIGAGLRGAEGPLPMTEGRAVAVRTYGPLRLAGVRCAKASPGRCEAHRDVTVVLSNAVSRQELRAHTRTAMPSAAPAREQGSLPRRIAPSTAQALGVDPRPGQRYRVTLTAGLRDTFGQRLARDVAFDVDIESPFAQPQAQAQAAAEGEPTPTEPPPEPGDPRPRRPRLDYELRFGVQGSLVEATSSPLGAGHVLSIASVNMPTYGLAAAALQEQEALRWLSRADAGAGEGPRGAGWRWEWISPGVPENIRAVRTLQLDALLASTQGARVVLVGLTDPSVESPSTVFLGVTDLGVTARVGRYGGVVWVTRLTTGAPVSGAAVAVRTPKREIFSATTDAHGVARLDEAAFKPVGDAGARQLPSWLFVRSGEDWVYQPVERASADRRAAPDVDLAQNGEWEGLVFTDRGVYRPGETIKLSALVRRSDATGLKVPPPTDVRIEVKDAEDDSVFSGHAVTDAFGELSIDVPLPAATHLGQAAIRARVGRSDDDAFATSVTLAAYKASEFQVSVEADRHEVVRGETATFSARAAYLYGSPMAGAAAHSTATRSLTTFEPKGADGFVTTDEAFRGDEADESPRTEPLHVDDGDLDGEGRLVRSMSLEMKGQRTPELVTFETEVEDLTRQTVAASASVLVHPAPFYLGLRRPTTRFVSVGATLKPDLVAFEPSGVHRAGVPVRVELVSRAWTTAAVDVAADVPQRVTRPVDTVVGSCDAKTTSALASCALRVPLPGYFIVRATSAGPVVRSSTFVYAVDDRSDAPGTALGWDETGARGLRIETDKETYAGGETARVLIRSPFKEADALITLERAGVLWQDVVHVRGPMPVVNVPIKSEYYPNVFVGVHLVRGRVAPAPAIGQADLGAPDFRTAVRELAIDREAHRLHVVIAPSKSEYGPGEIVDADVSVLGEGGRGVRAGVTFYAVDEGALMLTSYKTPDPLPAFGERKRLADFGVESRERLARFIPLKNGERVPVLGYDFEEAKPAPPEMLSDKGANGGGGGAMALRADFRTTAYFEPGRVTSGEGIAHFQFKLPDNLTKFRLMAVVASADDRFGFGERTITSSRALMARPALPRLLRVGDTFEASVVVSTKIADVSPHGTERPGRDPIPSAGAPAWNGAHRFQRLRSRAGRSGEAGARRGPRRRRGLVGRLRRNGRGGRRGARRPQRRAP
jgi:hypothetical protein